MGIFLNNDEAYLDIDLRFLVFDIHLMTNRLIIYYMYKSTLYHLNNHVDHVVIKLLTSCLRVTTHVHDSCVKTR